MLVLDTTAALRYAHQHIAIGEVLSQVAEGADTAILPAVCLAEAARASSGSQRDLLLVLAALPRVIVAPLVAADAFEIGERSVRAGSLGMAHAAVVAVAYDAQVATGDVRSAQRALPPHWPIVEV